ncbi:hypothetical protein JVT61DRAFT_15632 [Boletus reticuloceps]|uniref:Uncharacterized protein n=1 Tax=Boletus reticuloceps TaxID=495285 RepID=A0A8I3A2A9_9AGAM|nr:hypothetical protein JVT61DRAFT_15632 [Boletus reticuloceps]
MDLADTKLLHLLHLYLESLLEGQLPYCSLTESNYTFHIFAIDLEWEEDIGREGVVEAQLGSHVKGPIVLTEQDPGLSSIVDVLGKYLTEFPGSAILKKWVSDLIESAKVACEEANVPFPSPKPNMDAPVTSAPSSAMPKLLDKASGK